MIVGLTGYAQHGKDAVGDRLADKWGYTRFAFADELRAMLLELDPYVGLDFAGTVGSAQYVRLTRYVARVGWDRAKELSEVGRLVQAAGDAVRRVFGEDVLIRALERRWTESGVVKAVVTDVRMPLEAAWIRRHGGLIVRVERPGHVAPGRDREHSTERHVEEIRADLSVDNSGTLEELADLSDDLAVRVNARKGA